MIRYIITLKRLAKLRIHPRACLVNGVSLFVCGRDVACARIHAHSGALRRDHVRARSRRSLVIIRRFAWPHEAEKRRADRKDFIRVRDSLRLLPPRRADCSTPQSGENYLAGWEMPTGRFYGRSSVRARLISRF